MNKLQEIYEAKARVVSEKKSKDGNVMNVVVPFIQADEKNINGRIYPKSLLQREITRVQGSVKRGSFIGTGDHPFSGLENIATASHIVTSLTLDDKGKGMAELRILPTERGKAIQTLIRNDAQLGVSIRGFGDVGKDGVVASSYKLVGLDVVMKPSFKGAVFDKSNIFESVEFSEEKEDKKMKDMMGLTENYVQELMESCYEIYQKEENFKGSFAEFEKENGNAVRASILVEEGKCADIEEALKYLGAKEEIVPIAPIKRVTPAEIYLEATMSGVDPKIYAEKLNENLDRQEESDSVLNMGKIIYILSEARQAGFDTSDEQEKKKLLGAIRKQETRKVITEDERAEIVARKTGSTAERVKEIWAFERKKKEKEQKRIAHYRLINAERAMSGFGTEIRPDSRKRSMRILEREEK